MTAQTYINDAGIARHIKEIWVDDNGVARRIQEIWVNDNGVPRAIFLEGTVSISNVNVTTTNYETAFYRLLPTGVLQTTNSSGFWISPQGGMDRYEVRATTLSQSGSGTFTGTTGAWLPLTSVRTWSADRPSADGAGADIWQLSISIRRAADSTVVDTATITLTSSGS